MRFLLAIVLLAASAGHSLITGRSGGGGLAILPAPVDTNPGANPLITCDYATNPLDPDCYPTLSHSQEATSVSVTDISTKVYHNRGDSTEIGTKTWALEGMKNERVFFQLFFRVPTGGVTNFDVNMSSMIGASSGFVISSQTIVSPRNPFAVSAGSYTQVSTLSAIPSAGYDGVLGGMAPAGFIPKIDPYYGQATNAFPIPALTEDRNQGVLFSVIIPTHAPSDFYKFSVTVDTGATPISVNQGILMVWDRTMPSQSSVRTFNETGYADLCMMQYKGVTSTNCKRYHGQAADDNDGARIVNHDQTVFMLDYRWSTGNINVAGDTAATAMVKNSHLVQGTTSSVWINPLIPGAKLTTLKAGLQSANQTTCTNWLTAVNNLTATTNIKPFEYTCDEPSGAAQYALCKSSSAATQAVGCPSLMTASYSAASVQQATPTINAIVPGVELMDGNRGLYDQFLLDSSSNSVGIYGACPTTANGDGSGSCNGPAGANATGKGTGYFNHHLDGRAVNNRMGAWAVFMTSSTIHLNSTISYCQTYNDCGGSGNKSSTKTWGVNGLWYKGQGDESWTLPGTTDILGVGISTPIVIPLMNLVLSAAGMQDYEYLKILQDEGGASAQVPWTQINTFVVSLSTFNTNAYLPGTYAGTITSARKNLGCAVHRLTWPSGSCGP